MTQLNSVILEGNVTRLPDIRETAKGFKVCRIPIAINRYYRGSDGKSTQEVSYFDVETFGKMAEKSEQNVEVGRGLRVVGRLKQNRWTNAEGVKSSRVTVIAEHLEFKPRVKKSQSPESESESEGCSEVFIADEASRMAAESMTEEEVAF